MQLSIRNRPSGTVVVVDRGEVMTTVKIEIAQGHVLTSAITKESAQELQLEVGKAVTALVKATDVAVAIP